MPALDHSRLPDSTGGILRAVLKSQSAVFAARHFSPVAMLESAPWQSTE
jgi:hypothetical protein